MKVVQLHELTPNQFSNPIVTQKTAQPAPNLQNTLFGPKRAKKTLKLDQINRNN